MVETENFKKSTLLHSHTRTMLYNTVNHFKKIGDEYVTWYATILLINIKSIIITQQKGYLYCGEPPDHTTVWSGYY